MKLATQEFKLQGIPICRGIAIGKPYFFELAEDNVPNLLIRPNEVDQEIKRYRVATFKTCEEIRKLKKKLEKENLLDSYQILEAELQMLQDPLLTNEVEIRISKQLRNSEIIFKEIIAEYERKFQLIEDPHFRDRFKEIQDITRRMMSHLLLSVPLSLKNSPKGAIVFAKELTTADIGEIDQTRVFALVTSFGAVASHAAIIAKAKRIPYVTSIDYEVLKSFKDKELIVDGRTGEIIVNPNQETKKKYLRLSKQLLNHDLKLNDLKKFASKTTNGSLISLYGNIESSVEIDLLHQFGAAGVGLFRSENAFIKERGFPSEEEQYLVYKKVILQMKGLPIIIRTFDVGGDKFFSNSPLKEENNPYLGCRAIRFFLKEKELFKAQIRAILRAGANSEVSVMFPMISCLQELQEAKQLLREVEETLFSESKIFVKKIKIGCMIEVPSAAILADLLAQECDFLSIGTNDLIQYALAADRTNHSLCKLYNPAHPSVIRLIKMIVEKAKKEATPVMICGEIASDPRFTSLLLGLGVEQLSVAPRYLPLIKNAIRATTMKAAREIAKKALSSSSTKEIQQLIDDQYRTHVPDDVFYNI